MSSEPKPVMKFIGVRSSWEIVSRNELFSRSSCLSSSIMPTSSALTSRSWAVRWATCFSSWAWDSSSLKCKLTSSSCWD
ncbi:hypothetical protein D3C78_1680110 [compost metagenome]